MLAVPLHTKQTWEKQHSWKAKKWRIVQHTNVKSPWRRQPSQWSTNTERFSHWSVSCYSLGASISCSEFQTHFPPPSGHTVFHWKQLLVLGSNALFFRKYDGKHEMTCSRYAEGGAHPKGAAGLRPHKPPKPKFKQHRFCIYHDIKFCRYCDVTWY
jgi:hypothetical protein